MFFPAPTVRSGTPDSGSSIGSSTSQNRQVLYNKQQYQQGS